MARPYDRTRYYLGMGDFVRLIGFKGEKVFFRVALLEVMAQQTVLVADPIQAIPGTAVGHFGGIPNLSDPQPEPFDFLEPVQELKLFQIRLTFYPVTRVTAAFPAVNFLPPVIGVEYSSPTRERRAGTDKRTTVTMNTIANVVGGKEDGRIPANQIRRLDDPNEVFDIFMVHGYEPAFDIANGTPFPIGPPPPATPYNFYWYLASQGRKYLLGKPRKDELEGLMNGKIPYRAITLGGISTITTEA